MAKPDSVPVDLVEGGRYLSIIYCCLFCQRNYHCAVHDPDLWKMYILEQLCQYKKSKCFKYFMPQKIADSAGKTVAIANKLWNYYNYQAKWSAFDQPEICRCWESGCFWMPGGSRLAKSQRWDDIKKNVFPGLLKPPPPPASPSVGQAKKPAVQRRSTTSLCSSRSLWECTSFYFYRYIFYVYQAEESFIPNLLEQQGAMKSWVGGSIFSRKSDSWNDVRSLPDFRPRRGWLSGLPFSCTRLFCVFVLPNSDKYIMRDDSTSQSE